MASCDVATVTVCHNSSAVLEDHLRAVRASLETLAMPTSMVVVDSGSTDDTTTIARRSGADVHVVELPGNLGYGAGVNAGVRAARPARAYIALNPDTRPRVDALAKLVAALDAPGVGIAVPRLVDVAGTTHRSLRRRPTVLRAVGEATLGGPRAGARPWLGEVVHDDASYERPGRHDWATGAVFAVSAACAEKVGPWTEDLFLYSEETDYALRAADEGFALEFLPTAIAVHIGGESAVSPKLYSLLTVNRVRLHRRREGATAALAMRAALLAGCLVRAWRPTHRAAALALLRPADRAVRDAGGEPRRDR